MIALPATVLIEGGELVMGSSRGRKDEQPTHRVSVASFRAAISPVTNAEYARYVESTAATPPPWIDDARFGAPGQPVVGISWFDAIGYCAWLASSASATYRLPTEAEREYASLGGLREVDWPWGGPSERMHPRWYEIARLDRPHAPFAECANGYGLLCAAENVHEWCSDWYAADYYSSAPSESPSGPRIGTRRVSRGGSWRHAVKFTRVTARASLDPHFRYNDFGFRVYSDP